MDLRPFVLICLAAAFRPQPSSVLEVEAVPPSYFSLDRAFNETDFQRLRDAVNSGDPGRMSRMYDVAQAKMWPSFLKAHPEEGWRLFKKLAKDKKDKKGGVRMGAAMSPAWPMLLETHNAEAWHLFEKLAKDNDVHVLDGAARSPAWPMLLETHNAEAWHLFEKLATQGHVYVREGAVLSPAWPMLLETHNAEAWHLFGELAKDKPWRVRMGAAKSPAWPTLLETRNAEAWRLFEKLATDKDGDVRRGGAPMSPAWPDLIKLNLLQSWQIFAELMDSFSLDAEILAHLPSWKAFGKVPPTAVAERDKQELQDIARSLQKVADHGVSHEVKGLPLFDGFSTHLQRSTNETWLGEMVELPLFARNAAQRVSPAENVYLDCLSEFFS